MICRLCQAKQVNHLHNPKFDVCDDCATELGIYEMPASTRPARPCDRCSGMAFVRAVPRIKSSYSWGAVGDSSNYVEPLTATFKPRVERGLLGGIHILTPHQEDYAGRGAFEAFICVNCGFVEWYCEQPRSIPLGPEHMAEYIDYNQK